MSPQARAASATDTTSTAQGRFTIQLPAELKPMIIALGDDIVGDIARLKGIKVSLSMAEIVGGVIQAQHEVMLERKSAPAEGEGANDNDNAKS